jgi:hypothetical protein
MKNEVKFAVSIVFAAFIAMSSTIWADEAPAVPGDVLTGAAGIDDEEKNATYNLADVKVERWSADGGKNYLHTGNLWSKLQYEDGGDWQADLSKYCSFIDTGDGDKMIAFTMPMSVHYGWIQNFSEQGKSPKAVKNLVWKMRMYIPAEFCTTDKNAPDVRFLVRDDQWNLKYIKLDDSDIIPFSTIGSGWHTVVLDFANKTYDFGGKKGSLKLPSVRKANGIEIVFNGKGMKDVYPLYIDWLSIEGLQ